jgi:hypothetical protein
MGAGSAPVGVQARDLLLVVRRVPHPSRRSRRVGSCTPLARALRSSAGRTSLPQAVAEARRFQRSARAFSLASSLGPVCHGHSPCSAVPVPRTVIPNVLSGATGREASRQVKSSRPFDTLSARTRRSYS